MSGNCSAILRGTSSSTPFAAAVGITANRLSGRRSSVVGVMKDKIARRNSPKGKDIPKACSNGKEICETAGELHPIALVRRVYPFCGFVRFFVIPKDSSQNRITDIGICDGDIADAISNRNMRYDYECEK